LPIQVITDCQSKPSLIAHDGPAARQWATSEAPQDTALPEPYAQSLNSFQKMLVLKIFREEKLVRPSLHPVASAKCIHGCIVQSPLV
jgi:hypothetical protein